MLQYGANFHSTSHQAKWLLPPTDQSVLRGSILLYTGFDLIVGVLKDTLPLSGNTEVVVEN